MGGGYETRRYEEKGARHLLPPVDARHLREKASLERHAPRKEDSEAYAKWRQAIDEVNKHLREQRLEVARDARLLAMTTTGAAFSLDLLRRLPTFDLVVTDEASQVSRAYSLALAPLGARALYAGDPKQLSPIVQCRHPHAAKWLGRSMFRREGGPQYVFLDEQSRMAPAICSLVSNVFYDGKLRVAEDAAASPAWREERALPAVPSEFADHFRLERVSATVSGAPLHGGATHRFRSAERVVRWVHYLNRMGFQIDRDLLILTPFRDQRALIRQKLQAERLTGVAVSTVHRAQGRERHTIFFDPVNGASNFLQREEARRLINVALSRAQARLVVFLSDHDKSTNALLNQIATVASNLTTETRGTLTDLARRPDFPASYLGQTVEHRGRRLRIDAASDSARLTCTDLGSGKPLTYDIAFLRGSPK
jgi:superfamily I DNA and/or RNA helicase